MNARIIRGAAVFALVVPLVAITQGSANAQTTDKPTYRDYTVGSTIDGTPPAEAAMCQGDDDNRDSLAAVNGDSFPLAAPLANGQVLYQQGRPIGYAATEHFVITCHDDHTSDHEFDL